jgi:shikimate 5-dehydrogenase
MHNAAMAALGLNWRYLACDVDPARLREAIIGATTMGFVGLNLTVPHKLLAVELVDELDRSAREWGAVNTVRFEGETATGIWKPVWEFAEAPAKVRSVGFNTDADAIIQSLGEDLGRLRHDLSPGGNGASQGGEGGGLPDRQWPGDAAVSGGWRFGALDRPKTADNSNARCVGH